MLHLVCGERWSPPLVCAALLRELDPLALPFSNQRSLQLGDGSDELSLEDGEWVARVVREGEPFFDELDGDPPGW